VIIKTSTTQFCSGPTPIICTFRFRFFDFSFRNVVSKF